MRISNSMIKRNYLNTLSTTQKSLNDANYKVTTSRRFSKMSEDTAIGVRAMQVRRSLERTQSQLDTAKNIQSNRTAAEDTLNQINTLAQNVSAKFINAVNDTNGTVDRGILATELEKMQSEILQLANSQFSERYMFGGTADTTPPFSVDSDSGKLLYRGYELSEFAADNTKLDPASGDYDAELAAIYKDAAYADLGMGMNYDSGKLNTASVFEFTLRGFDFMGTDSNMYDNITSMVDMLRSSPFDNVEAGKLLDDFKDSATNVNTQITKMGADYQFLDFTINRLTSSEANLIEKQDFLEFADPAETIMDFTMAQYVYNAALQMGAKVLQPSLFNFLN